MRTHPKASSLLPLHRLLVDGRPPEYPVCHDGGRLVRWHDFAPRVCTLAARFRARPELRWLLTAGEPAEFAAGLLGLLHAGKQPVIPPNWQPGTISSLAAAFDAVADLGTASGARDPGPLAPIDAASARIALYTSGSSGEPKRVEKTLAQFEAEIATLESVWGERLGAAPVVATAPHQHIYGLLFRLLWPLAAGRPFDTVTCADPDTLAERLSLLGPAALVSSPAQLSRLPELIPLASLVPAPRLVFSSGGPLPAPAAAAFREQLGEAPTEVYGSTETGGIAWRRQGSDDAWTPLPGIAVAGDRDGALLLRSPFCTGDARWRLDDAVDLLPDGRFRLCGRLDRVVKIEEKRLSLPQMEARLAAHPWVAATAVVALGGRRQSVGAAVVLNADGCRQLAEQGRRNTSQALRRHLATDFETVLLPRHWRYLEQLPFNERGKLTQAALAALFSTADDVLAPA